MTTDDTVAATATRADILKPIADAPELTASRKPTPPSKSDAVIKLLLRAKGATPVELIAATDWQAHSVRAFLSGLRKKGRVIVREPRKSGEAAYRIVVADAAVAQPVAEQGPVTDSPGATDRASAAGVDA